jgi:WD40 repeat protein
MIEVSYQRLAMFKIPDPVKGVAFSPDGERLATGADDLSARVWDISSGQELGYRGEYRNWVNSVAFSPDGKHLATASGTDVEVWDISTLPAETAGNHQQGNRLR